MKIFQLMLYRGITLVGINLLPVKKMGDRYRLDALESKYSNEISP